MSKIIKNASFYTIGNILPQAVGFIILPLYTRFLSPSDYGIVSSLQVLSAIITIFLTLAIDRSVFRLYFDHKTDVLRKDYLGTITIALLFISTAVILLLFIFRGVVGQIYKSIPFFPYYYYSILAAFFAVFQIIPKIYFQLNEQAGKFVLISFAQFTFNTCFTLWFVIAELKGAEGMLKGELLANIMIMPVAVFVSYKAINFRFNYQILKESLHFSLPLIPGLISAFVLNLSDRIFIERYFTLADVGIYSLGYKIAGLISVLASSFLLAYGPVFYRYASSENQPLAKEKLLIYNNAYIIITMLIGFFIALFSKEAIFLLLDPKYWESYKIIPIIALSYIIIQVTALFNMMIYQSKRSISLMKVGFVGAGISILLNFILVPLFGAYGAAFATLLSFLIVFFMSWKYAIKSYYIPLEWRRFLILLLTLTVTIVICNYLLNLSIFLTITIKILVSALLMLYFGKKYYDPIFLLFKKNT